MKIANPVAVLGEDIAADYLKKKNFKILERNFRKSHTEIDIIATIGATLVFVEVKTRRSSSFGSPFESIPPWKVKNLIKTAQFYKQLYPALPDFMRIDAIGVILSGDNKLDKLEHLENISGF